MDKHYLTEFYTSDLGRNVEYLHDIVQQYKNSIFIDLGVRGGNSSAVLAENSQKNNNKIYGVDITFDYLNLNSSSVKRNIENNSNYFKIRGDSSTVGKNWDTKKKVNILFVDTFHVKEFVLTELYFWYDNLNENSHIVFHDTCWPIGDYHYFGGIKWDRVEIAVQEFFNLPDIKHWHPNDKSGLYYEDDNILVTRYTQNYGMTFVKLKNKIDHRKNIKNWKEIIDKRNYIVSVAGGIDATPLTDKNKGDMQYELVLTE